MTWKIEIIETDTGTVVRTLEYKTERSAETAERGLLRQINTDKYHTYLFEDKDTP